MAIEETGSFSAAAKRLGLSKSVVSHHVARLEDKLGVSLFFRSSRRLSLTPEGQSILTDAREMVIAGEKALDTLSADLAQPVGSLRITAPTFGEKTPLRQSIWDFADSHPQVALNITNSDLQVDLIKEGLDLAIRVGVLRDSSLKCRRIADFHRVVVAAPSLMAAQPNPRTPQELMQLPYVSIKSLPDEIVLVKGRREVTVAAEKVRIEVDAVDTAKSAILSGLGFRQMPLCEVEAELAAGTLVQLLPAWSPPVLGVFAVWPDIGPQKKLTKRLIDFVIERFEQDAPGPN